MAWLLKFQNLNGKAHHLTPLIIICAIIFVLHYEAFQQDSIGYSVLINAPIP